MLKIKKTSRDLVVSLKQEWAGKPNNYIVFETYVYAIL